MSLKLKDKELVAYPTHPLLLNSDFPFAFPYPNTPQLLSITLSSKYTVAWRATAEDYPPPPAILSLPPNFTVKRFIKKLSNMAILMRHASLGGSLDLISIEDREGMGNLGP